MKMKAVIFDLDNTLYDESLYFREVIVRSADRYSLNKERMLSLFDSGTLHASNDIFGDLLRDQGKYEKGLQNKMFELYRTIDFKLLMSEDVVSILAYLRTLKIQLGILTNGDVRAQRNKVRILNLDKIFDRIIYARDEGKDFEKPHKRAFERVLASLNVKPEEALFVGDNFTTDIIGATNAGLTTVWISPKPDKSAGSKYVMNSILDLKTIFDQL